MRGFDFSSQSKETVSALENLLSLYGDEMYRWLARLYDPDVGGFYYSNSARDYEGFLPDVESTAQALYAMGNNGLYERFGGSLREALPDAMREKIIEFTRSLQADDGYFYHPQWGEDITAARKGRDLGYAVQILTYCGVKPYWNTSNGAQGYYGEPDGDDSKKNITINEYRALHYGVASTSALT